jgi:hypothetical protein
MVSSEPYGSCSEAIVHGPLTRAGRCPWCGRKLREALAVRERFARSELDVAYSLMYDPDEGGRGPEELERRWKSGTAFY